MRKPNKVFKAYYEWDIFDDASPFRGVYIKGDIPTDDIDNLINWLQQAKHYLTEDESANDEQTDD